MQRIQSIRLVAAVLQLQPQRRERVADAVRQGFSLARAGDPCETFFCRIHGYACAAKGSAGAKAGPYTQPRTNPIPRESGDAKFDSMARMSTALGNFESINFHLVVEGCSVDSQNFRRAADVAPRVL